MLLSMAVIESSLESREVKSFDPILSSEPNLEPLHAGLAYRNNKVA